MPATYERPEDFEKPHVRRYRTAWARLVPEYVRRYMFLPESERAALRAGVSGDTADRPGAKGIHDSFEDLITGDRLAPETADLIARGLALLSFSPGGVTFCLDHYDAAEIITAWRADVEQAWGPDGTAERDIAYADEFRAYFDEDRPFTPDTDDLKPLEPWMRSWFRTHGRDEWPSEAEQVEHSRTYELPEEAA